MVPRRAGDLVLLGAGRQVRENEEGLAGHRHAILLCRWPASLAGCARDDGHTYWLYFNRSPVCRAVHLETCVAYVDTVTEEIKSFRPRRHDGAGRPAKPVRHELRGVRQPLHSDRR